MNKIVDVPETLLDRWLDQEGLPYAPVQYSPDHLQGMVYWRRTRPKFTESLVGGFKHVLLSMSYMG